MRIQQKDYPRDIFLRVLGVEAGAWTQRTHRGDTSVAFGLPRVAHTNQYGELDIFSAALTIITAFHVKLDMGTVSEQVRKFWAELTEGLARSERLKPGRYLESWCFVVATSNLDKSRVEAAVGPCEEVMTSLDRSDVVLHPIPLDLVAQQVRERAKKVGVTLPKFFVPHEPDSAGYREWMAEVANFRRFANTRGDRKKTKEAA